jgi:hypothetical protein
MKTFFSLFFFWWRGRTKFCYIAQAGLELEILLLQLGLQVYTSISDPQNFQKGISQHVSWEKMQAVFWELFWHSIYLEWVQYINVTFHCSNLTQFSEDYHLCSEEFRIEQSMATSTLFPETQTFFSMFSFFLAWLELQILLPQPPKWWPQCYFI